MHKYVFIFLSCWMSLPVIASFDRTVDNVDGIHPRIKPYFEKRSEHSLRRQAMRQCSSLAAGKVDQATQTEREFSLIPVEKEEASTRSMTPITESNSPIVLQQYAPVVNSASSCGGFNCFNALFACQNAKIHP